MQISKLNGDEIRTRRTPELDRDISFQPAYVGEVHRLLQLNGEKAVPFLKLKKPWQNPICSQPFGNGDTDQAADSVSGNLPLTRDIEYRNLHRPGVFHDFAALARHRHAVGVTNKQAASNKLFEPLDPANDCR